MDQPLVSRRTSWLASARPAAGAGDRGGGMGLGGPRADGAGSRGGGRGWRRGGYLRDAGGARGEVGRSGAPAAGPRGGPGGGRALPRARRRACACCWPCPGPSSASVTGRSCWGSARRRPRSTSRSCGPMAWYASASRGAWRCTAWRTPRSARCWRGCGARRAWRRRPAVPVAGDARGSRGRDPSAVGVGQGGVAGARGVRRGRPEAPVGGPVRRCSDGASVWRAIV